MKCALSVLLIFFSSTALAEPYFFSNPYSPYPPGCITTPVLEQALDGDNVIAVWSGPMPLANASQTGVLTDVNLKVYRAGCAESNRSVILLEFTLNSPGKFVLPGVEVLTDLEKYPMVLASEPNSWGAGPRSNGVTMELIGDFTDGWDDAFRFRWVYVLDVHSPATNWHPAESEWDPSLALSSDSYNDTVKLLVKNGDGNVAITIPPTNMVLEATPRMELNGRLSGNWVVAGANDQGVMLSFSSIVGRPVVPIESPLLVFLSWYTFDAQGEMLWLTGAAEFQAGADEVLVYLVAVSNGSFMSSTEATRKDFGQVRLTAKNCNDISMDYSFPASSGLGSGSRRLQRLFALEIAGFACRDFDSRLADNVPGSTGGTQ